MEKIKVRVRPKSRINAWNEFEKQLIEYVKERPVLYDPKAKLYRTGETRKEIRNRLWKEIAAKWNYSVASCNKRWILIKRNYIRLNTTQNKKAAAYKKYMDGRLSFLNPFIPQNKKYTGSTSDLKEDVKTANCDNESIAKILMDKYKIENKEKFTDFEERLIDFVKDYPILYDLRISLNIVSKLRKQTINDIWKILSVETDVSVTGCQKAWDKISMQYYRLQSLKDNVKIYLPSFLIFDKRLDFLKPMFLLVKDSPIDVYRTESMEDTVIHKNIVRYYWNDFQLEVIDFVKENPIIYDTSQRKLESCLQESAVKKLWIEFANKLQISDFKRGLKCWFWIKTQYEKFLSELTDKTVLNSLPLCYFRYQKLSFLTETFINTAPKRANVSTKLALDKTNLNDSDNDVVFIEDKDKEDKSHNIKTEEENNLYDSLLEVEDNLVSDRNIGSHYDEPRPSTSTENYDIRSDDSGKEHRLYNTQFIEDASRSTFNHHELSNDSRSDDSDNKPLSMFKHKSMSNHTRSDVSMSNHELSNDMRSDVSLSNHEFSNDMRSDVSGKKPIHMFNHHELSTLEFFRKIGEIVTENFNYKKQKDIRYKSWGLVTKLELAMLQEDDETPAYRNG